MPTKARKHSLGGVALATPQAREGKIDRMAQRHREMRQPGTIALTKHQTGAQNTHHERRLRGRRQVNSWNV
jgi:hypothetical protein